MFELIKYFNRASESMSFPWSVIDFMDCFFKFVVTDHLEVCFFRKVLTKQAISIFIGASLPRAIGFGEIDIGIQGAGNVLVSAEFSAVIKGDGVNMFFVRPE